MLSLVPHSLLGFISLKTCLNMFPTTLLKFSNPDFSLFFMSFLGFVSKIDFLVIKITNFTHKSGYLGKVGALGSKMSTPKAYEAS
jgi:hypothetical protein